MNTRTYHTRPVPVYLRCLSFIISCSFPIISSVFLSPLLQSLPKPNSQILFTASVPRFLQPLLQVQANIGSQNFVLLIVHNVPDDTGAIHFLSLLPFLTSRCHLRRPLFHNDIVTHISTGTEKNVVLSAIRHWRLL
jgi:hypothetical protein